MQIHGPQRPAGAETPSRRRGSGLRRRVVRSIGPWAAVLWLLLVNVLFFGRRIADSSFVESVLQRMGWT